MRICVFCSANSNIDRAFFEQAHLLGQWIGSQGHTLVYGGCDLGLMECVARATFEAGGQVMYGLVEPECAFDSLVQVFIIKDYSVVE